MPPLPVIGGRELLRVLMRLGWEFRRQNGSHMILGNPLTRRTVSIPDHRERDRGTLRSLLRDAGISVEELVEPLK